MVSVIHRYTCGRVTGYQYGHPNGIVDTMTLILITLMVLVSLVDLLVNMWTFLTEVFQNRCPCSSGNSGSVRSFMGTNYFCESGNPTNTESLLHI